MQKMNLPNNAYHYETWEMEFGLMEKVVNDTSEKLKKKKKKKKYFGI
jgi:hypothetical protein